MVVQHLRDNFVNPLVYETTDAETELLGVDRVAGGHDDGKWRRHQGGPRQAMPAELAIRLHYMRYFLQTYIFSPPSDFVSDGIFLCDENGENFKPPGLRVLTSSV